MSKIVTLHYARNYMRGAEFAKVILGHLVQGRETR